MYLEIYKCITYFTLAVLRVLYNNIGGSIEFKALSCLPGLLVYKHLHNSIMSKIPQCPPVFFFTHTSLSFDQVWVSSCHPSHLEHKSSICTHSAIHSRSKNMCFYKYIYIYTLSLALYVLIWYMHSFNTPPTKKKKREEKQRDNNIYIYIYIMM